MGFEAHPRLREVSGTRRLRGAEAEVAGRHRQDESTSQAALLMPVEVLRIGLVDGCAGEDVRTLRDQFGSAAVDFFGLHRS